MGGGSKVGGGVSGRECTRRGTSRRRELRVGVWQGCRRVGASRCLIEYFVEGVQGGGGRVCVVVWVRVGSDVSFLLAARQSESCEGLRRAEGGAVERRLSLSSNPAV